MSSLRPEGSRRKVMSEINVVPYIDVMLVLVVILMVSAPFVEPSVVNLPTVAKASKAPDKVISVVVPSFRFCTPSITIFSPAFKPSVT